MSSTVHVARLVAEAVKDLLNAATPGTFSRAFTARRAYAPQVDLTQTQRLMPLSVYVVPSGKDQEPVTRTTLRNDVVISVGVLQSVPAGDDAAVDALMDLVQEIESYVSKEENRRLNCTPPALWQKVVSRPIYDQDALRTMALFRAAIMVHYQLTAVP